MEFKLGDVVQLKSGGPEMTIKYIGKQNYSEDVGIWCIWFEHVGSRQEVKEYTFDPVVLKVYEPPPSRFQTQRV